MLHDVIWNQDPQPIAEAPEDDPLGETASAVVEMLGSTLTKTTVVGWIMLFAGILVGLIASKIVQTVLRRVAARCEERHWKGRAAIFRSAAGPAGIALFAAGLAFGLPWIHTEPDVTRIALRLLSFLYILAIGLFLFNLVDLVEVTLRLLSSKATGGLDAILVPLIRKALRVFVVAVFTLFVAENVFGADITAWLAGFGIAGLAVSLSAQDSIKNLFGSITILLDKPFGVGDRIIYGDIDGFVEEIGFRSTRIRTFPGHLVTVPNMKFIDSVVENVSRRPAIRRVVNIGVIYGTSPELVERAISLVKSILQEADIKAPFQQDTLPPRVHFTEMKSDNLNLEAVYWYMLDPTKGQDWLGYLAHGERFNLRVLQSFNEAGIQFAFPTKTLVLAGDPDQAVQVQLRSDGGGTQRVD